MSWSTIYIHGRTDFKKAVEEKIKSTWLHGYPETELELMMYWLRDDDTLREFKLSIGSKIIFKYRLQFFASIDEFLQLEKRNQVVGFSRQENQMVRKMVNWQKKSGKVVERRPKSKKPKWFKPLPTN